MHYKLQKHRLSFARSRRIKLRRFKVLSRHPFAVPVIVLLVFGIIIGGGLLFASRTHRLHAVKDAEIVVVSHDHIQQIVPTRAATVGVLLSRLHLTLNEGDVVEPAINTPIDQDQFRINIYRAVPVAVIDNGHRSFTFSAATTPRSIATQTGAKLFPDDEVSINPARDFVRTDDCADRFAELQG